MDNAAANTTFIECLGEILNLKDAEDLHFRCLSHVLNLGVQDILKIFNRGLEDTDAGLLEEEKILEDLDDDMEEDSTLSTPIGKIISKVRNLFKKIRFSEQLREKLRSYCIVEKIDFIEPVRDIKTRWNSTFDMLSTAIRLKRALELLIMSVEKKKNFFLSEIEWELLSNIVNLLFHFKKLSDLLCGEEYVTLSLAVFNFNVMLDKIEKTVNILDVKKDWNEIDELFIIAIQAGRDKMLKHYRKFNWIYSAVIILDPRFKLEMFKKNRVGPTDDGLFLRKIQAYFSILHY